MLEKNEERAIGTHFLQFLINHLVLPPKLPQSQEEDLDKGHNVLLDFIYRNAVKFGNLCDKDDQMHWKHIVKMLSVWKETSQSGALSPDVLETNLMSMKPNDVIAVYVHAQNAGLVFRKSSDSLTVTIDSFEASPLTGAVIQCEGNLLCTFPNEKSVTMASENFSNHSFVHEVASMVSGLNSEDIDEAKAKSWKAGKNVPEEREVRNPKFMGILMSILLSMGKTSTVHLISKRIRDNVCYNNARLPWRRSPLYLTMRVALQMSINHVFPGENARQFYKNFIAFIISDLCVKSRQHQLSSHLVHVINVKLVRRLSKEGFRILDFVNSVASKAVNTTSRYLDEHLRDCEKRQVKAYGDFEIYSSLKDVNLVLTSSKTRISKALSREQSRGVASLHSVMPLECLKFGIDGIPLLKSPSPLVLLDFEAWVEEHLKHVTNSTANCLRLKDLLDSYYTAATVLYSGMSEQNSIMILILLEIWMAIDRMVCYELPLMERFTPELPSLGKPLLLPKLSQMRRLAAIEKYLNGRHARSSENCSHFAHPSSKCFAAKYYDQNNNLHKLRSKIEAAANQARLSKRKEWELLNSRYNSLIQQSDKIVSCTVDVDRWGNEIHATRCLKCQLKKTAASICIEIHEWPLPEEDKLPLLKTVVFELFCPKSYAAWRDVTWKILQDLGQRIRAPGCPVSGDLKSLHALSSEFKDHGQRVRLCSTTKTFARSHYRTLNFPIDFNDVLKKHALQWQLHDDQVVQWTHEQHGSPSFHSLCMTPLSDAAYLSLQPSSDDTIHSTNEMISKQEECSKNLNIEEYQGFSDIRFGGRTQWLEILLELSRPVLTLNTEAVATHLLQAAIQSGTSFEGKDHRLFHALLIDSIFATKLLDRLNEIKFSISANWKEEYSMFLLINLSLRIGQLTKSAKIKTGVLEILDELRGTTYDWMKAVEKKLSMQSEESSRIRIQRKLLKIACLCRQTFDVDTEDLDLVLRSNDNVAKLVETATLVHDNIPGKFSDLSFDLRRCIFRDRRIAHQLQEKLCSIALQRPDSIGMGILRIWDEFQASGPWMRTINDKQTWISVKTQTSQFVDFNAFSGELLVGGQHLRTLPREYLEDPVYYRIFRSQIIQVAPSELSYMSYKSVKAVSGQIVHFQMDSELIIRTKNQITGVIAELIPDFHFRGDLPFFMVSTTTQWLNVESKIINFRPLSSTWSTSACEAQLLFSETGLSQVLLSEKKLVEYKSRLGKQIVQILSPIEAEKYIMITMDNNAKHRIEVKLQRFGITFFLNDNGELESSDLAGIIDSDQAFGAFIGLQSRLVIKHLDNYSGISKRSIILPFGKVSLEYDADTDHCQSKISCTDDNTLIWFRYEIDTNLRQLRSRRNDHLCLLFKIYLHAISAHCRADPLTGRTGTEEAIYCLREPALLPISPFNPASPIDSQVLQLLNTIAGLTPARNYYPEHLKKMESVTWVPGLSPLAQHDEFVILAERIITRSNRLIALSIDQVLPFPLEDRGDSALLKKASIRNACLRPFEFGGSSSRSGRDEPYLSQDAGSWSSSAQNTYEISHLLNKWPSRFHVGVDLSNLLHKWNRLNYRNESVEKYSIHELLQLEANKHWGGLYKMCRGVSNSSEKYFLMFLFGKMAFGKTDLGALRFLIAVAISPSFIFEAPPGPDSYNLSDGSRPNKTTLLDRIRPLFQECGINARNNARRKSEREKFERDVKTQTNELLNCFLNISWPTKMPIIPSKTRFPLLENNASISAAINPLFKSWFENFEFELHIERVSAALRLIHEKSDIPKLPSILYGYRENYGQRIPPYKAECISLHLQGSFESFINEPEPDVLYEKLPRIAKTQMTPEMAELYELVHPFTNSSHITDRIFGDDIERSIEALKALSVSKVPSVVGFSVSEIENYKSQCKTHLETFFDKILQYISQNASNLYQLQQKSGISPRLTPTSFLSLIATSNHLKISSSWRDLLVQYGVALTMLQRAERLERFAKLNDVAAFYREIENRGHENWDPSFYPDWLLMEIEGGFLVRRIQAEVAFQMISPSSNKNALMQLNMGEGKTSVIIPLVAAVVANGTNLARVVVLKALVTAMSSNLSDRLGHMVNRKIHLAPFSRKTLLDDGTLELLFSLWEECCKDRGILLTQPEHLQSFKLIGMEQISHNNFSKALKLLETRRHWEQNGRNVIDESDAVLDAKCQLIYTIGTQQAIDGESDRWQLVEGLLTLVGEVVKGLTNSEDVKLAYNHETAFPALVVRQGTMTNEINKLLVERIVKGELRNLHFQDYSKKARQDLKTFILNPELSDDAQLQLIRLFQGTILKKIILLRGLIAGGVLAHCLYQKRWMVEYGGTTRTMLAVPYIAKGVPSQNSEFGHPDVAITLTCITYYMAGLTDDQLKICFHMLYKVSDPSDMYSNLRKCSCWPEEYTHLKGVNLEDTDNIRNYLYPHLRYNKDVIDFFLSAVVFPKECKEFPKKLTTSAWDIPAKKGKTTGFSGTCDNRYLLPLSINQEDLPALVHTTAMVLSHILRPENRGYQCVQDENRQRLSVASLIDFVSHQHPRINVLIDIGAQVLELGNKEVAKMWLSKMPMDIEAALYFDSEDQQIVMSRDGKTELLASSKYQDRLENCVVYMDEVHTRGTDIKLPSTFKAAVTLGPRVTKDRFVQGCMRMRGLGRGQSIMTLACPEIDKEVRDLDDGTNPLSSFHVLKWCLEQTRLNTQRNQPLWVHHGLTYYSNKYAEDKFFTRLDSSTNTMSNNVYENLIEAVQEDDATTLLNMYGPKSQSTSATPSNYNPTDVAFAQQLLKAHKTLGNDRMRSSSVNEEQEKEVAHEKEVQTEIERPPRAIPLPHTSHKDVKKFIQTGLLPPIGVTSYFSPAFDIFTRTSAATHGTIIAPKLLVTDEFANSIESNINDKLDEYLKPTNYILTRVEGDPVLVFISQYEANLWYDLIQASNAVCMHIFAPKNARDMRSLDNLDLFTMPSSTLSFQLTTDLRLLLGIFSGQLYLNNYTEYLQLCELLPSCYIPPLKKMTVKKKSEIYKSWVKSEMLEFVRSVFEIRRKGRDFSRSHMGRIVNREILKESDFEG